MKKRLNYRKLMQNWMQFYSLTADTAKKMFASIWTRLQASKQKSIGEGTDQNETHVE